MKNFYESNIKVGVIVGLASGGPKMTIYHIDYIYKKFYLTWHFNGEIKKDWFGFESCYSFVMYEHPELG